MREVPHGLKVQVLEGGRPVADLREGLEAKEHLHFSFDEAYKKVKLSVVGATRYP